MRKQNLYTITVKIKIEKYFGGNFTSDNISDPDPGDPKRPNPTESGSATVDKTKDSMLTEN